MAASSECEKSAKTDEKGQTQAIIDEWLLDLALFSTFQDFTAHRAVDKTMHRDTINGIINTPPKVDLFTDGKYIPLKQDCIHLMCRLVDGEDYQDYIEDEDPPVTPLESAARVLEELIKKSAPNIRDEIDPDIINQVKTQAVYVCCRDNAFDTGRSVFTRLWGSSARGGRGEGRGEGRAAVRKRLLAVLDSGDSCHQDMDDANYPSFLDNMTEFLSEIMEVISSGEPLIWQAAERVRETTLNGKRNGRAKIKENSNNSARSEEESSSDDTYHTVSSPGSRVSPVLGTRPQKVNTHAHNGAEPEVSTADTDSNRKRRAGSKDPSPQVTRSRKTRRGTERASGQSQSSIEEASPSRSASGSPKRPNRRTVSKSPERSGSRSSERTVSRSPGRSASRSESRSPIKRPEYRRNIGRRDRHEPSPVGDEGARGIVDYIMGSSESETEETDMDAFDRSLVTRMGVERPLSPQRPRQGDHGPQKVARRKWTDEEEERLYQAARELGVGNWAIIKEHYGFIGRTQINLKDKWRTILKQGRHKILASKHGKIKGIKY